MIYGSVCSGIEAASVAWHPLGWRASFLSEIEAFPRAVLTHHYPTVPLHGDFTTIEAGQYEPIDILVGGTPCQSFSVAGLRGGLADKRGNLALEFIKLADRLKPPYVVWENVPGVLSSDDGLAFQNMIDGFTQIGYVCDVEILDAQFFGLAQCRARVFLVCVLLEDLLPKKTPLSKRIAGELLLQPLLETWAAIQQAWCPGQKRSASMYPTEPSVSSIRKKIELLETALDGSAFTKLQGALGEALDRATAGLNLSGLTSHQLARLRTQESGPDIGGFPSSSERGVSGDRSTASSWNNILDALSRRQSESITSTSIPSETQSAICIFAGQSLNIVQSIINCCSHSEAVIWSSDYWHLASLLLTTLEAITQYAQPALSNLFVESSDRDDWRDHLDDARGYAVLTQQRFGDWRSGQPLFSLPQSLRWNPPPRRQAGENVAPTISSRPTGGGGLGTDFDLNGGLIARSLNAHANRCDGESETFVVAHALRGERHDASEDETGRGVPLVTGTMRANGDARSGFRDEAGLRPVAFGWQNSSRQGASASEHITPTLDKSKTPAVAFPIERGNSYGFGEANDPCFTLQKSHVHATATATATAVRRLTPVECERLQGFPSIKKRAIILVCCSDRQKTSVFAEIQNRKLRPFVSNADTSGLPQNVNLADKDLPTHLLGQDWPVVLNVQIDLERSAVLISSQGRSIWSASTANATNSSPLSMPLDAFVRLSALMQRGLVPTIHGGEEASQQNTNGSSPLWTGSVYAAACGQEIVGLAKNAEKFTSALTQCTKSTTSEVGLTSQSLEQTLEIWSCCVASAISGCIPEEIRNASSYAISVETIGGYTLIPYRGKSAANGPRYKALGNSMAVPVMAWIGRRIAAVDAQQ